MSNYMHRVVGRARKQSEKMFFTYMIFVIFGVWVNFCSTQKSINRDKMDFSPKQRKAQKGSIHCKCEVNIFMWSNNKLLHIADMEQFVIAPHDEIASHDNQLCHVLQNCLSCGATNIMYGFSFIHKF